MRQVVDLDDDAVDVVTKIVAVGFEPVAARNHRGRSGFERRLCGGEETPVGELMNGVGVRRVREGPVEVNQLIREKRERTFRGRRGIFLTQASRGGVARIGELLCAQRHLLGVHLEKIAAREKDLTAHFNTPAANALKCGGHVTNRSHVVRHVFAHATVASRRGAG